MKLYIFAFLLFSFYDLNAQIVIGYLKDADAKALDGVLIYNLNSKVETRSKFDGSFEIFAHANDVLRFVDFRIKRQDLIVLPSHFNEQITIELENSVRVLEEVKINYKPSGNLEKDVKHFKESNEKKEFNEFMANITKTKPSENLPRLSMPKSIEPNKFEGQVNIVGLAFAAFKLIKSSTKPKPEKANYFQKIEFQNKMKQELDFSFFKKFSQDEYELETFIAYCDEVKDLSKIYRYNFNKSKLQEEIETIFKSYQKKFNP